MVLNWISTSSRFRNSTGYILRSVHTFSVFLNSNWGIDFGHAEAEWSEKASGFLE